MSQHRAFATTVLFGLGLLLALAGCGPRPGLEDVRERVVLAEDFEQLDGWLPEGSPSLNTERAHSGRYSIKVDKEHPYSITYRLTLGQKFTKRPRLLRLSAWVWVTDENEDAQLVFAVNPPNAGPNTPSLFTTRLYLADNWPYKRWTHLTRDIPIPPPGFSSQSTIVLYLWQCSAQNPVFADDLQLTEVH